MKKVVQHNLLESGYNVLVWFSGIYSKINAFKLWYFDSRLLSENSFSITNSLKHKKLNIKDNEI